MTPNELGNTIRLDLPATYQYLHLIGPCIRASLESVAESERQTIAYNSELAVYETCTNIVEHAYGNKNGEHVLENMAGRIQFAFCYQEAPRALIVRIHDTGRALEVPLREPDVPEPGQHRGYGLFLVYQLMDDVEYHSDSSGNHWQLIKHL